MITTESEHKAFIKHLKTDLKTIAVTMERSEARSVVDLYYQIQEYRKATKNQARSEEPNLLVSWLGEEFQALEKLIIQVMNVYTDQHVVTRWAKSLYGVGPVLTAGFYAYIDIEKAPTYSSIWRYAGCDPSVKWVGRAQAQEMLKGCKIDRALVAKLEVKLHRTLHVKKLTRDNLVKAMVRRPWNDRLKVLAWKFGECQVKFSNHDDCFYGHLYQQKKARLMVDNEAGKFADAAAEGMTRVGKSTDAYSYYKCGLLPPAHIHNRATRYIRKIFLAHWHEVAYRTHFDKAPPNPYAIEHLGHAHKIEIPNYVV